MGAEPKSTVDAKQHCHTNYWPSGSERRKEAKKRGHRPRGKIRLKI